ncbi:cysteine desulfurase family protein [Microbacterium sp. YY-01]|uniref:cysteine desulfurase family protein n=1 Tax=Microbacterium sp. YY-01 TaxID=3421634 RepID=UPI003D17617F
MLYLDHAATSPVRPEVLEAMTPYLAGGFRGVFGNPSSHHTVGEAAARALDDARARVAAIVGMRTNDVVFTSGGTEANNLAVKGVTLAALAQGRNHVVISQVEHESIHEAAAYLERFHGTQVTRVGVDEQGRVCPDAVAQACTSETALVSLAHANNEIGTVQPVADIVRLVREHRIPGDSNIPGHSDIPVHIDAVQSAGWLPLAGLGADAVSLAGHKLGAPKGIGVLAVRGRIPLEPLLHGGGQERGKRSGTENVAAAVGFATALECAEAERAEVVRQSTEATAAFIRAVLDRVPCAALTGSAAMDDPQQRLPSIASFTFSEVSGEAVLLELERRGIVTSSGSACAAGSDDPSPVLLACGIEPRTAQTSVRFAFGRTPLPPDAAEQLALVVAESVAAVTHP